MGHSRTIAQQAWGRGAGWGMVPLIHPTPLTFHLPVHGHVCLDTLSSQGTHLNKLHTENVQNGARHRGRSVDIGEGGRRSPTPARGWAVSHAPYRPGALTGRRTSKPTEGHVVALGRRSTQTRPSPQRQRCTRRPCFYSSLSPLLPQTCVRYKFLVYTNTDD